MDFQFQPGSSSMFARNVGAGTEEKGDGEDTKVYGGRGAGGKLRSSRRSSIIKTTPYDRPASGRHSTAGGLPASSVSAHSSSSLASRLVGSASRLITSSASYFFPSLFGRKTLALTNGNPAPAQGTSIDKEDAKEESDPVTTQETENRPHQSKKDATNSEQDLAIVAVGAGSEKKELDLAQVEDMLKQKTWSREQVSRLTDLLNTRLVEHPPTISRLAEAGVHSDDTAVNAVEVTPRRPEENTSTPISEAQRWREELKRAHTDCVPIEVAKAFMGERTSSQSGLARSFRGTPHLIDRVAELQPPPGLGLTEDRYRSFPVLRSWSRSPATQVPKRSPLLDEDWMSVGPVRRTRQKTFHMNSSPYARGLPAGDPVLPRAIVSPPVQSSQTARKILDTLEMMSPSPKARLLNDDPMAATEAPMSLTPDIFNLQGRRNLHRAEVSRFSSLRDTSPSNGKLEFGSPSYHPTSTIGAMKESNFEDKSLVNRLLSNNEAALSNAPSGVSPKGISSTTSLLYSTATNSSLAHSNATVLPTSVLLTTAATSASFQPDRKPLFSFSIPSSTAGSQQYVDKGSPATVPALSTFATMPVLPALVTTSVTCASSTAVASTSIISPPKEAATEDQLKGLDATVKEPNKVSNEKGPTGFQFGSSPPLAPWSFKMGTDDIAAGGQSKSPFLSPFSSSKTTVGLSSSMLDSSPAMNAAVSTAFGSQLGAFPLFKPSTPGQLFGASSSIMKPSPIHSLTIEPSSAPFTFSPPPAPISCSTPTFPFNASTEQVSVSCSIEITSEALPSSPAPVPSTDPVFSFTSPSGGPKLPIIASEDTSLPAPKFTFGRGASLPSGELSAGSAPLMASFQSGVASAPAPSSFTFGGQTASSQLFGSGAGSAPLFGSGAGSAPLPSSFPFGGQTASVQPFATVAKSTSSPFSAAESLPTSTQVEPPASFASGAAGSEKAGRKFLKAKRRK